ncbi:hypothetical protein DRO26_01010 [Candidatus Bathyarchaeota archaeon]|nr:MAG: hypothetical protein DRO26_01010 [Candidatus Bathyarchaeota archaeon]
MYVLEGLIDVDVDSNVQKLLNLYHSQKPVWLETDAFTVAGKITDLELPYEAGQTWRRYRLELTEVPFWGTTIINEGEQAYLSDLDFQCKVKKVFPTFGRHNFTFDRTNKKFSFEFVLVNELEETGNFNVLWDDDQTSFWSVVYGGSGSLVVPTLSNDSGVAKRGNNSLKIKVGSGSYSIWYIYHDFASAQDFSDYDFLAFWWYGQNTGNRLIVALDTTPLTDFYDWYIYDDWSGWKRVVLPLRNPDYIGGSPSLTNINRIRINGNELGQGTFYLDRGGVDVGNWVKCEIQVPDELDNYGVTHIDGYSNHGYVRLSSIYQSDTYVVAVWGDNDFGRLDNRLHFLDGTTDTQCYGPAAADNEGFYPIKQRGETTNATGGYGSITYSQAYGCLYRVGFAIKMPPWTGSDDLTGKFAINKTKLKIEIYWEKENTNFIDGSV